MESKKKIRAVTFGSAIEVAKTSIPHFTLAYNVSKLVYENFFRKANGIYTIADVSKLSDESLIRLPAHNYDYKSLYNYVRATAGHAGGATIVDLAFSNSNLLDMLAQQNMRNLGALPPNPPSCDEEAASIGNDTLALLQLIRYASRPNWAYLQEIENLVKSKIPHFYPITCQRIQDIRLRFPTTGVDLVFAYSEFGKMRASLGDIPGSLDCDWRSSSSEIDKGEFDKAESMLLNTRDTLLSPAYVERPENSSYAHGGSSRQTG